MSDQPRDSLGWCYTGAPKEGEDARCIVWLQDRHGMEWCGLRAYHGSAGVWLNGNEPISERVLCWMPRPGRPLRRWSRGKLTPEKATLIEGEGRCK